MQRRFPIGSWVCNNWSPTPEEMAAEWADLGFTLTLTPWFDDLPENHGLVHRLVDEANRHGMQVILCDRRTLSPRSNWSDFSQPIPLPANYKKQAAAAVNEYAAHPAVWGFYVEDEPLCGGLPAVAQACRIIEELTDQAEPYINLLPNHRISPDRPEWTIEQQVGFDDYSTYLDHVVDTTHVPVLSYDCYSQMSNVWGGTAQYFRNLASYQSASIRNNVPFWTILLAIGHWMYRAPTPLELSWQFYTSLAYGASGILYYYYRGGGIGHYGAAVDELGQKGQLYYQMRRQHHHFQSQWEDRYRRCRIVRTSHWPKGPGGTVDFDGRGVVEHIQERSDVAWDGKTNPGLIVGEFMDDRERPHVLLANASASEHVAAVVNVRGRKVYMIEGPDKETELANYQARGSVGEGWFERFIMPGQALFVRVEK
ncbi:MAG: hypothetical protein K9N51_07290 [Candidatus Pacebacteria bacterium]|nr:hypothetical protein [Candidatus Paceibacterota bacterium]